MDRSLRSGYGRFCINCKRLASFNGSYKDNSSIEQQKLGLQKVSDLNKLKTFVSSPKKYATGTERAKAKVEYLDSLLDEMDDRQRNQYLGAKEVYESTLKKSVTPRISVSVARIVELVKEAIENHHTLTITYKGFTRDIHPYNTDGKYCIAYCTLRRELRTFRIDRMEDVHATGIFNPDQEMSDEAADKIADAPSFRNYRSYRRY